MNPLVFLLLLFLSIFCYVEATPPSQDSVASKDELNSFQPSVAVVVGILAVMFSLTFILLVYAKFCHIGRAGSVHNNQHILDGLIRPSSRFSGIDKTVIESLPFFRFSSLKGLREGMECAVCLSKFEDIEVLRLLPKCKHAFHITCVDQWLENHSSCPLCRHKISVDDLTYSNSLRFLSSRSEVREDSNMELFVQREESRRWPSRFSIASSFSKFDKGVVNEEELPIREKCDGVKENDKFFHKLNHKIIMSDVVLQRRWSNLSSSDLMLLNSEMLGHVSSNRFSSLMDSNTQENSTTGAIHQDGGIMSIKEDMKRKRYFEAKICKPNQNESFPLSIGANTSNPTRFLSRNDHRSMSDLTFVSRFNTRNSGRKSSNDDPENAVNEERLKRLWLPIAQTTVQGYASVKKKSQDSNSTRQSLNV